MSTNLKTLKTLIDNVNIEKLENYPQLENKISNVIEELNILDYSLTLVSLGFEINQDDSNRFDKKISEAYTKFTDLLRVYLGWRRNYVELKENKLYFDNIAKMIEAIETLTKWQS